MDAPVIRSTPERASLRREVGLARAVLLGLGSTRGTGVFVSIGVAAGAAAVGVGLVGHALAHRRAGTPA